MDPIDFLCNFFFFFQNMLICVPHKKQVHIVGQESVQSKILDFDFKKRICTYNRTMDVH